MKRCVMHNRALNPIHWTDITHNIIIEIIGINNLTPDEEDDISASIGDNNHGPNPPA